MEDKDPKNLNEPLEGHSDLHKNENETEHISEPVTPSEVPVATEATTVHEKATSSEEAAARNASAPEPGSYLTEQAAGGNPAVTAAKRQSLIWMAVSLVLAVVLVVMLVKPLAGGGTSKNVAATVNGEKITENQLYKEILKKDANSSQILDSMINDELVRQAADKAKVTVSDAEINKEVGYLEDQYGSKESLDAALTQSSLTRDDLKGLVINQLRLRKLLSNKITVTDAQVKEYFDQNKASLDTPEKFKLSGITVATQAEADAVLKQLKGGADFAKLAKEKSVDTASKDKGGDLGFVAKAQLEATIQTEVAKLKKGDLSPVIKTETGFKIVKLIDTKAAVPATYEARKDQIKDGLASQQVSQLQAAYMEELTKNAKIVNNVSKKTTTDAAATTTNQ
ncbi:foldase protein PrsA [Paenibacillus shirakamiensis]|uniref:Foldase protein PrsA n=1 Tax=Paenibacillus shirakamiensis TaxID=1265935 RepID=A0ABS4JKD2_9BACL|nr:peptidyl-prolyl cis-trans isomerase [Paenibacillus shirakamiensis]MBP2002170.1 foldase protein PrsA [Paenibacillus shirakamiensis]